MSTLLSPRDLSDATVSAATASDAVSSAASADFTADETTGAFLATLRPHGGKALVFEYGEGTAGGTRRVQPGYHVTEIKDAQLRSVDCGGGAAEAWRETVVQLWDVPGGAGARHMTVDKFLAIWRAVDKQLHLDDASRLVVEAGDDVGAAVHYAATSAAMEGDALVVRLGARRATCKPRDRYYAERGEAKPVRAPLAVAASAGSASACCTPAPGGAAGGEAAGAPCCG